MAKHYYVELDEQQYGPFTLEQIRSFGILPDVLICVPQDSEEWKQAKEYEELKDLFRFDAD